MRVADDIWHEVFSRDGGKCQYCDMDLLQDFHHYQISTVDHLRHRSQGGEDSVENLVLSCHGCNTRLSRAGHLHTLEERKAYLSSSSRGARAVFEEYRYVMRKS